MPLSRSLLVLLCLHFLLLPACMRQKSSSVETEILRHGHLAASHEDVHPIVYINVRDNTNQRAASLQAHTEASLRLLGYTTVDNPSQAGYILQIVVLAAGVTSQEHARSVVDSGYGAKSTLTGGGSTAIVADVLLVQRQIPAAKQPDRVKFKNISRRNAVANSQMRIGLLTPQEINLDDGITSFMMETLASELACALHEAKNTKQKKTRN